MKRYINKVRRFRIWTLFLKELRQIKADKKLVVSLILPPTLQLVIFGFALNPEVTNLRLGLVDESRTAESRELISAFVESGSFRVAEQFRSSDELGRALSAGVLDAGLIVPADFAKQRERRETARAQFLLDAVNSNTAGIAGGYAARIIGALNERIAQDTPAVSLQVEGGGAGIRGPLTARIALLFNPGLESAWFIVTGVLGILLALNGSIIGGATMVKEKEAGTIEQLLMTPAQAVEIVTAKIAPLFALLSTQIVLALVVARLVFGLPIRGSLVLLFIAGMLCVLAGIGIGTFLATFSKSQQQAQLMSFFVNPPLSMLSGATTPVEAMPEWMQPFTLLNPISHFATIARGVLIKGAGIEAVWPHMLALVGFAVALVGVSAWRFRKQLG
ncbi:MAG TPA: ABC transporter permease [Blastocatellia bacterium]|jgi:ABC-2 type transport system permease protein|nr:ABC transporter permease [Blastocatellia bacterium]